eukprot:m.266517 g.266517  ORF g.266517 m.266517 type:complete len:61 (-) comp16036_c0_seq30:1765-1947(-)
MSWCGGPLLKENTGGSVAEWVAGRSRTLIAISTFGTNLATACKKWATPSQRASNAHCGER